MMLAVSDVVVTGLYVALTGFTIAFTNVFTHWLASRKAEEVKVALEENTAVTTAKLDSIAAVGEKTHTLVNSASGELLRLVVELSRWKANREPTLENTQAVELAERMFSEHVAKQHVVDQSG